MDNALTVAGLADQRGLPRPFDVPSIPNSTANMADGSDIGSVELQASDFATAAQPTPTPAASKKSCKKKKKKGTRGSASAAKKKKKKCKKKRKKK